jgi:hypothetical protein
MITLEQILADIKTQPSKIIDGYEPTIGDICDRVAALMLYVLGNEEIYHPLLSQLSTLLDESFNTVSTREEKELIEAFNRHQKTPSIEAFTSGFALKDCFEKAIEMCRSLAKTIMLELKHTLLAKIHRKDIIFDNVNTQVDMIFGLVNFSLMDEKVILQNHFFIEFLLPYDINAYRHGLFTHILQFSLAYLFVSNTLEKSTAPLFVFVKKLLEDIEHCHHTKIGKVKTFPKFLIGTITCKNFKFSSFQGMSTATHWNLAVDANERILLPCFKKIKKPLLFCPIQMTDFLKIIHPEYKFLSTMVLFGQQAIYHSLDKTQSIYFDQWLEGQPHPAVNFTKSFQLSAEQYIQDKKEYFSFFKDPTQACAYIIRYKKNAKWVGEIK